MSNLKSKNKNKQLFSRVKSQVLMVMDCAKEEHTVNFFHVSKGQYLRKNPLHVQNNLAGFNFLLNESQKILARLNLKVQNVTVSLEDPASYSLNFINKLQQSAYNVHYVNATRASSYRENTRASSDNLDLDGIVRTTLIDKTYEVSDSNCVYAKLRDCSRNRSRLVKDQSRHKIHLHLLIDQIFPNFLNKEKSSLEAFSKSCINLMLHKHFSPAFFLNSSQKNLIKTLTKLGFNSVQKVASSLKELAKSSLVFSEVDKDRFYMLRARLQAQLYFFLERQKCLELEEQNMAKFLQETPYALLTSIPGLGIVSAASIAAELGEGIFHHSRDEIASYAGVTPRQKQSGGRQGKTITYSAPKAANKYLKNFIYTVVGFTKRFDHPSIKLLGITHPLKQKFSDIHLRNGSAYTATAKKFIRSIKAMVQDENIYMIKLSKLSPKQSIIWLEMGTEKMLEKWQKFGIEASPENHLGKWLKQKEKLIQILNEELK